MREYVKRRTTEGKSTKEIGDVVNYQQAGAAVV